MALLVLYSTTPTFQEVGGLLHPAYSADDIRTSHGIALTITQFIGLNSQDVFTFLFATVFN